MNANVSFNATAVVDGYWPLVRNIAASRYLRLQYVEDDRSYVIFAIDENVIYKCVLVKNSASETFDLTYTAEDNDADLEEWSTSYKSLSNRSIGEVNEKGIKQIVDAPRTGTEVIYTTHNLCDRCSWFEESIRVTGETLVNSGDNLVFTSAHPFWIDMVSGRVQDDDGLVAEQKIRNPGSPHGYEVIGYVDGTRVEMREPFEASGGSYEVLWASGSIRFFSPVTGTVTFDYSYANGSTFILRPLDGKDLYIEAAEADFTHDVVMTDGVEYNIYGYVEAYAKQYAYTPVTGAISFTSGSTSVTGVGTLFTSTFQAGDYTRLESDAAEVINVVATVINDQSMTLAFPYAGTSGQSATGRVVKSSSSTGIYPNGTRIPLQRTRYKRFSNIVQEAIGSHPTVPAIGASATELAEADMHEFRRCSRGFKKPTQAIPFRYATMRELTSTTGLELRVKTSHDRSFEGESATLTFYCTSHDADE